MRERKIRRPGAGGFTLIEVLIGIVLLGLIAIAVAAISITGVIQIDEDSQKRNVESTTAQFASLTFARDIQGAGKVVEGCAADALLAVSRSDDESKQVEYTSSESGSGSIDLIRTEYEEEDEDKCATEVSRRVVVSEISTVDFGCDGTTSCVENDRPDRITLSIATAGDGGPMDTFTFELDGTPRATDWDNSQVALDAPAFLALGGPNPLTIGGNSTLRVFGDLYLNKPTSGVQSVRFNTGPGSNLIIEEPGEFWIQEGGRCGVSDDECLDKSNKPPDGEFTERFPDPYRFLPDPDQSTLSVKSDCIADATDPSTRVCDEGIYESAFPPNPPGTPGGPRSYRLNPGVYVLRDGLQMQNGDRLESSDAGGPCTTETCGVLLFNERGRVRVQGGQLTLEPQSSGPYRGVLMFQARGNPEAILINGGDLSSLSGAIYAPASAGVTLGSGSGDMSVGRVVGTSLTTTGNGTVVVGDWVDR